MRPILFLLLLLGYFATTYGQSSVAGELLLERLREYSYTDEEIELFVQHLETLRSTPLNLNTATSEELARIPFFDDFFIRNFLQYRSRHGAFVSIYDLKNVPGARVEYISLLEPFFSTETLTAPVEQSIRVGLFESLSIPRYAHRQRLSLHRGKAWMMSWNAERDAGEKWLPFKQGLWTHHNIFLSYNAHPTSSSPVRRFILGDYRLHTALGVMNGMGISFYAKQETGYRLALPRQSEISPHNSFQEWNYLRGLALTLTSAPFSFTPYIGYTPLQVSLWSGEDRIRTIYKDGKQRLSSDQVHLLTLGGYFKFAPSPLFHAGFQALNNRFTGLSDNRRLYPPAAYLQELSPTRFAIDMAWRGANASALAEVVLPHRGAYGSEAAVAVLTYRNDYWGMFSLVARHLGERFAMLHTSTYGHFSSQKNEQGIRIAWNGELFRGWRGSLSTDFYRSIRHEERRPSQAGSEVILRMEKAVAETETMLSLKFAKRDTGSKLSFRFRENREIGKGHHLSSYFFGSYTGNKKYGWSLAAKLMGNIGEEWYYRASLQYYDTPTWLQAVRSVESNSPLHYYTPMLYGKGLSGALIAGYRRKNSFSVSLKTSYNHIFHNPTEQKSDPVAEVTLKLFL